jgi:hypothetical protein
MDWRTGFGTADGTGLGPDLGTWIRITPGVVKVEPGSGSVVGPGSRLLVHQELKRFGKKKIKWVIRIRVDNKKMVRIRTILWIP